MINIIKSALGLNHKVDYTRLMKIGARVVDVRTKEQYATGHIKGSINIPLNVLHINLYEIGDKNKPVITCCASGRRSGAAKEILSKLGYINVYNGGAWLSLNRKINA